MLPPVARAHGAKPAGQREAALLELVEKKFANNVTRFAKEVADRTGNTTASEKGAFYRIIRGADGRLVRQRLGIYATILGVSSKPFLQAWAADEGEAAAGSELPARLSPAEVRALFLELIERIDHLVDRVERLEQQAPSKRQQGARR